MSVHPFPKWGSDSPTNTAFSVTQSYMYCCPVVQGEPKVAGMKCHQTVFSFDNGKPTQKFSEVQIYESASMTTRSQNCQKRLYDQLAACNITPLFSLGIFHAAFPAVSNSSECFVKNDVVVTNPLTTDLDHRRILGGGTKGAMAPPKMTVNCKLGEVS
jgi:hypothetical protein